MDMTLSVIRYNNAPPQHSMRFTIGESGCNIGRNTQNDVVLPDPERWVSGHHATIRFRSGCFFLIDGSSNGTFLNNGSERVPSGQEVQLNDRDELTIGAYEIQVSIAEPEVSATDVFDPFGRNEPMAGASDGFDPFDQQRPVGERFDSGEARMGGDSGFDLLHRPITESEQTEGLPEGQHAPDILDLIDAADGRDQDASAGLLDASKPPPPDRQAMQTPDVDPLSSHRPYAPIPDDLRIEGRPDAGYTDGSRQDNTPQEHAFVNVPDAIPEDFDLLGGNSGVQEGSTGEGWAASPFEGQEPEPGLSGFDLPDLTAPPVLPGAEPPDLLASDPFGAEPQDLTASPDLPGMEPPDLAALDLPVVEPQDMTVAAHSSSGPPARVAADLPGSEPPDMTDVRSAVTEAIVPPATPDLVQQVPPRKPPAPADKGGDPVAAFLAGLGCDEASLSGKDVCDIMQTSGALLRMMTEGLMTVMRSRATFKSELRIEMTIIQSVENNPFKFSATADDALASLLFRRTRGFLPPIQAAQEAMDDIQAHEMAMIVGLRAALQAVLMRFEPTDLEQRFRKESVFDNLLPMARKAKCWDRFNQVYAEVKADADDDFLSLFGTTFTRAYEDQVRKLKEGRHRGAH